MIAARTGPAHGQYERHHFDAAEKSLAQLRAIAGARVADKMYDWPVDLQYNNYVVRNQFFQAKAFVSSMRDL